MATGVLAAAGWAVRPMEEPAWAAVKAEQPALHLDSLKDAVGEGLTVGLLGGFRAILADFFWIKAHTEWARSNLPQTQSWLRTVTAVDPRPLYFWLEAARVMASDMPVWRIEKIGPSSEVPAGVKQEIIEQQAEVALGYLDEALTYHPGSTHVYVDIAQIYLSKIKDVATAADYYHRAALVPDAPYFVSRDYAYLLHRLNRVQEAYDWLVKIYPTLPKAPGVPGEEHESPALRQATDYQIDSAQAEVVLGYIREWEKELKIPVEYRFKP